MEMIIAFIGLIFSFFFAGSETAFVSTNKVRFELWLRHKKSSALSGQQYFQNPDIFLSTTLVGNNISNIIATSYATVFLIVYINETLAWALITLVILLFGEILPKVVFRTHANSIILVILYPIRFFHFVFNPVIKITNYISSFILKLLKIDKSDANMLFDKDDITVFFKEAEIAGVVDEEEHKIIRRVLKMPDTLVREAMVPRTSIAALSKNSSIASLRKFITKTGYSKIPVYNNNIDDIVGVVFMFDFFKKPKDINQIIKPVMYVPENKKCNELLKEFKETNTSIAIVIDEYGGTAGLVTLEDVIEVLFGEFEDVDIQNDESMKALNKLTWEVDATETIDNVNDKLGLSLPTGKYETISGYVLSQLAHIPVKGEQIIKKNFRITVTRVTHQKILKLKIIKKLNT